MNSTKPKLSILINSMTGGGAERVVSLLLPFFRKEYEVVLVLLADKPMAYQLPENQEVVIIPGEHHNPVKNILSLAGVAKKYHAFLAERNIDVSLSYLNRSNFINCLVKKQGWTGRTVISERAFSSLVYKSGLQKYVGNYLIKKLYKNADAIIPISTGVEMDLRNHYGVKSNYNTILNPVDVNKILSELDKHPTKAPGAPYTFVCLARLDHQKNHRMLINAFAKLDDLNVKLVLLGDGPLRAELEALAKEKATAERIEFAGFRKDFVRYLKGSDCLVLSSDYEGLGNVLLEALACSLPIISTDCFAGPREILSPGTDVTRQIKDNIEMAKFGILTPVGDEERFAEAMRKLATDTTLQNVYKERALERAMMFNVEPVSRKWIDVLNGIPITGEKKDLRNVGV